jgi:hypothetical protein
LALASLSALAFWVLAGDRSAGEPSGEGSIRGDDPSGDLDEVPDGN